MKERCRRACDLPSLYSEATNKAMLMELGNWKTEKSHFLVLTGVM